MEFLQKIGEMNFGPINANISTAFEMPELLFVLKQMHLGAIAPNLLLITFFVVTGFILLGVKNAYEWMTHFKPTWQNMLMISVLLMWCIFSFAGISTFLYFNF